MEFRFQRVMMLEFKLGGSSIIEHRKVLEGRCVFRVKSSQTEDTDSKIA